MEEAEKRMLALKQAYAEVILNTGKEAAARVMTSERKAQRLEQDLLSAKEEAARMLLRLKQMMDAKVTEAQIMSLNQQRRINELEAQLSEAEGVIVDLRAELSNVQEQLHDIKERTMCQLRLEEREEVHTSDKDTLQNGKEDAITLKYSASGAQRIQNVELNGSITSLSIVDDKCCSSERPTVVANSDYDDIKVHADIFAHKEIDMYIKECNQEFQATGNTLLNGKFSSELDPHSPADSISFLREDEENVEGQELASLEHGKLEVEEDVPSSGNITTNESVKVCKLRRRRSKHEKVKSSSCRSHHSNLRHALAYSAISCCNKRVHASKNIDDKPGITLICGNSKCIGDLPNSGCQLQGHDKYPGFSVIRRSTRKRKVKFWDNVVASSKSHSSHTNHLKKPCMLHPHERTTSIERNPELNRETREFDNAIDVERHLETHITAVRNTSGDCNPDAGELSVCEHVDINDVELVDIPLLVEVEQSYQTACLPLDNCTVTKLDLQDVSVTHDTSEVAFKVDKNGDPGCENSRKRKKETSAHTDDITLCKEGSIKKRSGKKPDAHLELKNSSLMNNSPSDSESRQLFQVACQLITLSGKDRW